ncbi:hypothetical protein ACFZA2_06550 [Microbacterium sp. NPDC007973]|uniref:hypothetical protein n=1 Tax=Microbacterium sp. NPDC007973 TaxID=3364182 RepID=UPI0036EF7810
MSEADRAWFVEAIRSVDPDQRVVSVSEVQGVRQIHYSEQIRSGETRHRNADPEELARALAIALLCSGRYGYSPERMYIEQGHSIGRPSASRAQVDLVLYYLEEDGSETVFAMWEFKSPDEYKPDTDPLIEKQLFDTAPLLAPSLLVYATVKPQVADIECITIDYGAHKSFERWNAVGRPST